VNLYVLAIIVVAGCGLSVAARHRPGWPVLALVVLLYSLILLPKSLSHDPNPGHIGIAESVPVLATYTVILMCIAYIFVLRILYGQSRARSLPLSAFVFLAFLVVGLSSIWQGTDEQLAGGLQLTMGYLAWFVGGQLGPLILVETRRIQAVAGAIVGIVGIETVVTVLQRAGMRINPMSPSLALLMGDRTNGTTNHPDDLGKVLLLLVILCLGLMGTTDQRTRRTLWLAVVLAFIPLGLSQGRADLLAALTTIVLWALLSGRRWSMTIRVGVPLAAILITLPFAGAIITRVQEDPDGGPREGLAAAAIEQIHRQPWGVGPNSYVSVVSAYDQVTALGYPVHDTFLLTAAELGVLGAILFWLPVMGFLVMAWMARKRPGFAGSFGTVIVASAPGLFVVNYTGWAMISVFLLPLWFLIYGIAYSQFCSARDVGARLPRRSATSPFAPAPSVASAPAGPAYTKS